jgi:putative spermidine/putrescine transport system ATP-binding protein
MTAAADPPPVRGQVELSQVSVSYGNHNVVRDVSLDIAPGEFVCLLGPSGCGKTTTLRAIAGLAAIDAGIIRIDGKQANHLPAHQRGIAMVFQDLALFPHMTVHQNVAFGLRLRGVDAKTIDAEVTATLRMLHLEGLHARMPRQLSGGQQQRVAIARSVVVRPSVLLLDEPFAALDRKLREEMRLEIRALQRRLGITVVFVTHDQEEALTMSDRVVVMNRGAVEQIGTPSDIYETPASRFVMNFVGACNFLVVDEVTRSGGEIRCRLVDREITLSARTIPEDNPDGQREIAIRPERIRVAAMASPVPHNNVTGVVRDVVYEGAAVTYDVGLQDGQKLIVREQNIGSIITRERRRAGDTVILEWGNDDAVLIGHIV